MSQEQNKKNTKEILKNMFDIDLEKLSKTAQIGLDDVENNHDMCWVKDLYKKNKLEGNLDNVSIFYRGSKITYKELFENAEKYAAVFAKKGIKHGDEVPMIMSNCPEFLYSIMGLNLLGAKFNCFGLFDAEYLKEIIDNCNSELIICTDDVYGYMKDIIDKTHIKERLVISLADSLINGQDPYIELDKPFYDFENKVPYYKEQDTDVISQEDFLNLIKDDEIKKINEYNEANINTEFSINYSSGTTSPRPKMIVHTNRSFVTIGRFQDPDMSGLPKMTNLTGLALIPTHSNTGVISSMSDVLYKGCTIAMEPIYDKDFFMISLAINKPNYVAAPRNMIVHGAKQIYNDPRFKGFKMPQLIMLTSVGEATSKGEEKFINKNLRKTRAFLPLAIGGGDCEHGGMFFTPYRALQNLRPKYMLSRTHCALKAYKMVQMKIIDKDGKEVPDNNIGYLVVKTPTTLKKYKKDPEATEALYTKDAEGRKWSNLLVYAKREKHGTYEILERVGKELILDDGNKLPLFYIGKEVEKDTKNILSYEIVNIDNTIIIHVEFQPGVKVNKLKVLSGIESRVVAKYGQEVADKMLFRIRTFEEGFPFTKSGKRNYLALVEEGVTNKCIKLSDFKNIQEEIKKIKKLTK